MEEKIINIDEIEINFKSKYRKIAFSIIIAEFVFSVAIFNIDYLSLSFFLPLALFLPYIPNYFLLKIIKCPSCGKNYFIPFFASKDDMKKITKSNPSCINCNIKVKIISEYQKMY